MNKNVPVKIICFIFTGTNNSTMKFRFKTAEIGVFKTAFAGDAIKGFDKSCRIVGLTMGQFSLIDLIHAVLQRTGPARLIVATWSAGIKDAHQVRWLADTELITDFKLLTDHSYAARQGKYAASIEDLFGKENIRTSEMHAKFVLIENDDFKVSIMSSMNLNANKTCELFEVEEGSDVFDMLMNFACHHFDDMQPGFVKSATKVSQTVARFFEKHGQKDDTFGADFSFGWE